MFHFADALADACHIKGAPVAIGLDPHLHQLPLFLRTRYEGKTGTDFYREAASAIWDFNQIVLRSVQSDVVAVKPQFAFYEQLGSYGWATLEKTCRLAKELGLLIVADAKRGDISSTGAAYAQAILANDGPLGCDSVTLNPWMGIDTLDPFLRLVQEEGKGLFVLLRTTNPKSGFFQHHGDPNASTVLASELHKLAQSNIGHSGMSNIGAVVGASAHQEAQRYRKIHPTGWFLVPGVGAQGASPAEGLAGGNLDGLGSLIVASRSLLFPKAPIRTADYDVSAEGVEKSVSNATKSLVNSVMQVLDA